MIWIKVEQNGKKFGPSVYLFIHPCAGLSTGSEGQLELSEEQLEGLDGQRDGYKGQLEGS